MTNSAFPDGVLVSTCPGPAEEELPDPDALVVMIVDEGVGEELRLVLFWYDVVIGPLVEIVWPKSSAIFPVEFIPCVVGTKVLTFDEGCVLVWIFPSFRVELWVLSAFEPLTAVAELFVVEIFVMLLLKMLADCSVVVYVGFIVVSLLAVSSENISLIVSERGFRVTVGFGSVLLGFRVGRFVL